MKLFCDWSMLILQILWKKYRAKYDVASWSQAEENVSNVRSVAIMCTWFKEKSANIVTVGNPKIHLYFVLKEFVPVMVSLVTVHNYVTFNKVTWSGYAYVAVSYVRVLYVCSFYVLFVVVLFFSIPFVEIVSFQEPWKSVQLMIISFQ